MMSNADMPTNEEALILRALIDAKDNPPTDDFNDAVVNSLIDRRWAFTYRPRGAGYSCLLLANSQQGRDALRRFEAAQTEGATPGHLPAPCGASRAAQLGTVQ